MTALKLALLLSRGQTEFSNHYLYLKVNFTFSNLINQFYSDSLRVHCETFTDFMREIDVK